jgi:uncharacterized protein (DUF58 family)
MLPLPTNNAFATFAGAVVLVALGIALQSATCVALGGCVVLGLAAALTLTIPIGARLRAQRLELSWWQAHDAPSVTRGAVIAGVNFEVQASFRHRGERPLVLCDALPALPSHVRCTRGLDADIVLPPCARTELRFSLTAAAAGRVVMHGLSVTVPGPFDLFRAPLYFPMPLVVKALPRTSTATTPPVRTHANIALERSGQTQRVRAGSGTDLREIRELSPGDAFKSIAWKASAKAGKLLVREVESEVQETTYVVLDISGSMRAGPIGSRKLDHGIELASFLARERLAHGDRVGVITVDGRVVSHAHAAEGLAQLNAIHEALLAATEVVDQDLTETDDDELVALVARYLRHQDGVDYRRGNGHDLDGIVRHAASALRDERDPKDASTDALGSDRRTRILRRFCRARGLGLRYRAETRAFGKGPGLARALRDAAGKTRVPRSIVLISDFDAIPRPESLHKTLRMLRAQCHTLSCVLPDARTGQPTTASGLRADLELIYGLGEERRIRETKAMLAKMGIPLVVSSLRATSQAALSQLARARRVA